MLKIYRSQVWAGTRNIKKMNRPLPGYELGMVLVQREWKSIKGFCGTRSGTKIKNKGDYSLCVPFLMGFQ